jgi:hypothetical protein
MNFEERARQQLSVKRQELDYLCELRDRNEDKSFDEIIKTIEIERGTLKQLLNPEIEPLNPYKLSSDDLTITCITLYKLANMFEHTINRMVYGENEHGETIEEIENLHTANQMSYNFRHVANYIRQKIDFKSVLKEEMN